VNRTRLGPDGAGRSRRVRLTRPHPDRVEWRVHPAAPDARSAASGSAYQGAGGRPRPPARDGGSSWPRAPGWRPPRRRLRRREWLEEIFVDSDTKVALLAAVKEEYTRLGSMRSTARYGYLHRVSA